MDEKFARTVMNIEKKTYKNMIIDYLKNQLFNGRYVEGDRINESQLSKMFGVYVDKAEHHYEPIWRVCESAVHYTHWPTLLMGVLAFGKLWMAI